MSNFLPLLACTWVLICCRLLHASARYEIRRRAQQQLDDEALVNLTLAAVFAGMFPRKPSVMLLLRPFCYLHRRLFAVDERKVSTRMRGSLLPDASTCQVSEPDII